MQNKVWLLEWDQSRGFYTDLVQSKKSYSPRDNHAKRLASGPSLTQCLNEGYGTVADIWICDSKENITILKLGRSLRKYNFVKPWTDRPCDGLFADARGIRVFHGIRRKEQDIKIDPTDMFPLIKGSRKQIEIQCKEDRHSQVGSESENDTVFKFDIFIERKGNGMKSKNIWIDPILRNDGGGG